jgi:hypothetical protein
MSPQQKVPNLSNRGSQDIPSPLASLLKGFFVGIFLKKKGFKNIYGIRQ